MLFGRDKQMFISDAAYHSELMQESFPRARYGGAKAAIYAAYRFMQPRLTKVFTERRARALWEGAVRRVDAEESAVLHQAAIEEAKREQRELRDRLARLDEQLAVVDEEFHGPSLAALRGQMRLTGGAAYPGRASHEE